MIIWLIWAICFVFSMQIEVAFLWYIRFLLKLKPEQTPGFELNSSASVSGWFFYGSRWWNRFISPQSKPHLSVFSFIQESRLSLRLWHGEDRGAILLFGVEALHWNSPHRRGLRGQRRPRNLTRAIHEPHVPHTPGASQSSRLAESAWKSHQRQFVRVGLCFGRNPI